MTRKSDIANAFPLTRGIPSRKQRRQKPPPDSMTRKLDILLTRGIPTRK
jgi:hypothetical protein